MQRDELLALAQQCERAAADQQRIFIKFAIDLVHDFRKTIWQRAVLWWRCEAYESAAMTLVPEGWTYDARQGPSGRPHHWTLRTIRDWDTRYTERDAKAATPALALTAAALRAHAAQVQA